MSHLNNEHICLSLDEYIKAKKVDGSLSLMDYRKKQKNIKKEDLDDDLDKIESRNAVKANKSKFERYNQDSEDDSNDEDYKYTSKLENDVQMIDISSENSSIKFAKEIQQMDHPDCCKIKKTFKTIESQKGIKIKSQQWRVQNGQSSPIKNIGIRTGRVQKVSNNAKVGKIVEKGNFTYKYADNMTRESAENIVAIVRNNPVPRITMPKPHQNSHQQPININMNWNGFFKGVTNCMGQMASVPRNEEINVKIAASDYFNYLKSKREGSDSAAGNNRGQTVMCTATTSNKYGQSGNDHYMDTSINDYVISATTGQGIDGMKIMPKTTNLPLNLRYA